MGRGDRNRARLLKLGIDIRSKVEKEDESGVGKPVILTEEDFEGEDDGEEPELAFFGNGDDGNTGEGEGLDLDGGDGDQEDDTHVMDVSDDEGGDDQRSKDPKLDKFKKKQQKKNDQKRQERLARQEKKTDEHEEKKKLKWKRVAVDVSRGDFSDFGMLEELDEEDYEILTFGGEKKKNEDKEDKQQMRKEEIKKEEPKKKGVKKQEIKKEEPKKKEAKKETTKEEPKKKEEKKQKKEKKQKEEGKELDAEALEKKREQKRKQRKKNKEKSKRKKAAALAAEAGEGSTPFETAENETKKKKKKKKKEKKTITKETLPSSSKTTTPSSSSVSSRDLDEDTLRQEMISWSEFGLHTELLRGLHQQRFFEPTPIQRACLGPAIQGRKDIIGAAQTGSGKTLAFGLPIIHALLEEHILEDLHKAAKEAKVKELQEVEAVADKYWKEAQEAEGEKEEEEQEQEQEDKSEEEEDKIEEGGEPSDEEEEEEELPSRLAALILTPTRELALQVCDHLKAISEFTDIRIAGIVGGLAIQKQQRLLSKRPHIIVATPGRLWELVQQEDKYIAQSLAQVRYFVLDEADRMIEQGHFAELDQLVARLPPPPERLSREERRTERKFKRGKKRKLLGGEEEEEESVEYDPEEDKKFRRQIFVFSATLTYRPEFAQYKKEQKEMDKKYTKRKSTSPIDLLIEKLPFSNRIETVDLTSSHVVVDTLDEAKIDCLKEDKDVYLYYFLRQYSGRTLVFTNSIDCIRHILPILTLMKLPVFGLHAEMQQRQRLKNLDRFRSNPNGILIATDVAARGLDIPLLDHVIHYQLPRTAELYVHRSGRTARARAKGLSVMLVDPGDRNAYRKIVGSLANGEDLPEFPVELALLAKVRKFVKLARSIDELEHRRKKQRTDKDWFLKTAEELDLALDDDLMQELEEDEEKMEQSRKQQNLIRAQKEQLDHFLSQPILSAGASRKVLRAEEIPRILTGKDTRKAAEDLKHRKKFKRR